MARPLAGSSTRRRGRNEGSIYKDEVKGRWYAAVSFGYGADGKTWKRVKVSGRTRAEVVAKLKDLQAEHDLGANPVAGYTVRRAIEDWLADGLEGRTARTVQLNRDVVKPLAGALGDIELRKLTAQQVRRALNELARGHSSRTVVLAHNALTRAIRYAEANRQVVQNVAALVDTPRGQTGRPSRALTADQAAALMVAAQSARLGTYVVLCLMTGIRTEEARALRWQHVDLDAGSIAVWRSVRLGGDTKTEKSRRTLGLPDAAVKGCASTASGRRRSGFWLASSGRTAAWYSARGSVRNWTPGTCGSSSRLFARRLGWASRGRHENCGRVSSA